MDCRNGGDYMNIIESKHITMAYITVILFVISLFAGFAHWGFFILAALFGGGYFIIDRKYLRCPHCSGFTNLDRLSYAKNHEYHCAHCGEVIQVKK